MPPIRHLLVFSTMLLAGADLTLDSLSERSMRPTPGGLPYCKTPNAESEAVIKYLRAWVTATDPQIVQVRTSLGVEALSEAQVTQVSDENACQRASALVDSVTNVAPPSGNAVFVYSLGSTRFMVDRGWRVEGEYRTGFLFDSAWVFISKASLVNQRP